MQLRLPHLCQPGCRLCRGPLDAGDANAVMARVAHAEQTNQRRIYLQGLDLAGSPHLLAIVSAARARGLQVALVEEGIGLNLPKRAGLLQEMGIAQVYVSLRAVAPESHASEAASPERRKQALSVLVALGRNRSIAVGVHIVLSPRLNREIQTLLRLRTHLSLQELLVSEAFAENGSPELAPEALVTALEHAWATVSPLKMRLRFIGFERTRHANLPVGTATALCDASLVEIIRQAIPLPLTRAGVRVLGAAEDRSDVKQLAHSPLQLRTLALEVGARRSPFVDLPACLGGTQIEDAAVTSASAYTKSDACPTCPLDQRCVGVSKRLDGPPPWSMQGALRPLPTWYSLPPHPRILILSSRGGDPLFRMSTLPALAEALRTHGATVELVSPWLSLWNPTSLPDLTAEGEPDEWMSTKAVEAWLATHELGAYDLVIASDLWTARVALDAGRLNPAARIIVPDFHMLEGMDSAVQAWLTPGARAAEGGWWPSPQLILESSFPAYVNLYLNYGVPLEHLTWRPFALYPAHFPAGAEVHECSTIFSGGHHLRDPETLRLASELLPAEVHPIDLYAFGERFTGNAHLRHQGSVPIPHFCRALANSRFVVLPLLEENNQANGITVLAMALMAGRPIVASSIPAIRDYVSHGAEGLLVPPGDPAALADAITRLERDPALLAQLAVGARAAGRRLSTDHWAQEIMSGQPQTPRRTPLGWRNW